ncbi:hypothetical protein I5Q34_00105 [Streptomyces sp. AV19]|uniref:DUF5719 family protein n=1 Tax=Streptomyces sp. AV19 TaxID=2793068 RepID=UPI0018FED190|nr:DUF5719 family protein [Streptomyces sp. AV19]MBH1932710.1 hypothetical protein [Streptomyces sp. AV19]MDG4531382.1 DUF5719 family protein [Streptomyces sp. AV19]
MKRTTLSLFATAAALAAVTGVALVTGPSQDGTAAPRPSAARMPVQHTSVLCPAPTSSEVGETTYTAYAPGGGRGETKPADLLPAADGKKDDAKKRDGKPVLSLKAPGKPVTATTDRSDAPALTGSADGALAPGWTVQQTTTIAAGSGRGLQGLTCTAPDTSFWFPGVATAKGRQDYVHLTNPDATTAAVVDLELYGKDGRVAAPTGEGVTVPPRSTVPVLLTTLPETSDGTEGDLTLHVAARSGRVGAAVQSNDDKLGGDWLPASDAGTGAVLPGIPADATSVRLVAFAPGSDDADLTLRLAGPSGTIRPAGHESLHVKSGMTASADLGAITKGEPGSLLLTSEGGVPFTAGLRVTRGKGDKQETAFVPAVPPIGTRGTVADARAKGTTLSLTAPEKDAQVKVVASAGSEGGAPASRTYTVKGGTTLTVEPPTPAGGKGVWAVGVEKVSGGPVHASRMLALPKDGVPAFTIQPLPDDRSTVEVPAVRQDLSAVTR